MLEGLVLEVELHICAAVSGLHHGEEYFYGSFGDGFLVFGLAEFDFVAPDISHLVHKKDLVYVDFTPLVHNILDDLLALQLTHCRYVTVIHFKLIKSRAYLLFKFKFNFVIQIINFLSNLFQIS